MSKFNEAINRRLKPRPIMGFNPQDINDLFVQSDRGWSLYHRGDAKSYTVKPTEKLLEAFKEYEGDTNFPAFPEEGQFRYRDSGEVTFEIVVSISGVKNLFYKNRHDRGKVAVLKNDQING